MGMLAWILLCSPLLRPATAAGVKIVPSDADICDITACDALRRVREEMATGGLVMPGRPPVHEESQEERITRLERRLQSVEQPLWQKDEAEERWYRCCEGPCRCRPETFALSCWRQELEELPSGQSVPVDIRVIDLGINQISSLNRDTFKGFSRLTELDMFDNRLDFLPNVIFDNLESLTHLRLNRNRLEELHAKLFHKLANLETLDLSSNALRRLAGRLFRGTPRLVVLHLAGNGLEELPEPLFRGLVRLEELDLSSNVLLELPPAIFKGLTMLKRLKLHDNRLKQLSPVFGDLQFLDLLSLRRNRLTFIRPGLFDSQRHLTHLELTGNWISTLSGQEFLNLLSLRELHLGQNYLEHIPEGTFRECGQLDKLFLFSNNLVTLEAGTFLGLGNLTNLLLNNNLLRLMADTVFEPLTNLKKLQVDSNKFQYLPTDCLEYVPNLVSLKLAKNPWHCDCAILYLATWLRDNRRKVWDSSPTCRGPGDLGGRLVDEMNFDDLCDGQWASMVKLTPRVPIK